MKLGAILIPIIQMKKPRLREIKSPASNYMVTGFDPRSVGIRVWPLSLGTQGPCPGSGFWGSTRTLIQLCPSAQGKESVRPRGYAYLEPMCPLLSHS